MKIEDIAHICHEANRALCETQGDYSQVRWEDAPQWQRDAALAGVRWRQDNPDALKSAQHEQWMADKIKEGWVYGEVKDSEKKTHPCLVLFDQLPSGQQAKDALFMGIVIALSDK